MELAWRRDDLHFNLMVELEPNGVDVAQAYRGQIFRNWGVQHVLSLRKFLPDTNGITILSLGYGKMKSFYTYVD